MDGRIQEPIINYLKDTYGIKYVDTITEPGPIKILADNNQKTQLESIHHRVSISVNKHGSKMIVISGHHDCAGNPIPKSEQLVQIGEAEKNLKKTYPELKIIKLWITEDWIVEEL
jgi:hypothetical protein